ncbi:sterol desaturase [Candidatus Magnetomorum sp. HK-1]|nr:sterol desaturase [Candidatus Magnetomorum sp. HK-1]
MILENEINIRMTFFLGMFFFIALWEMFAPRRVLNASKVVRWYSNMGLIFFNSLILRWIFPVMAVGMALIAHERKWGLFNNYELPDYVAIVISIVLLDFIIYLQHAMFHAIPLLWRLHRMHHTDLDLDVSSGIRFHPIEIVLSMCIKLSVIVVIGPPVVSVLLFEIILNAAAMFNHGNIRIPLQIDKILRWFIVTPDMHRVHHSIIIKEGNSNFGFNLPWWDYIFGTYQSQPEKGHLGMTIGIKQFRSPEDLHLHRLMIQPFINC